MAIAYRRPEHRLPAPARRLLLGMGMRVGVSPQNWVLLRSTRPWWLYRNTRRIPAAKLALRPPALVSDADIAICERLLKAFAQATANASDTSEASGMWAWIVDTRYRSLARALASNDARELAELLASMFREEFVIGMAQGSLFRGSQNWLGSRIFSLRSLDALVSLAEALGIVPVENPEQGRSGLAFEGGIETLISALDRALGLRIDFPDVGAPVGVEISDRMLPLEAFEHIYAALRLAQAMEEYLQPAPESLRLVEIGGGYGGMCYWFMRMRPHLGSYTVIDLPFVNVLQGYFLAKTLGPDRVSLLGEAPAPVRVLPDSALAEVQTPFAVLVNKDSMPEMPRETMDGYLDWGCSNCSGLFYNYNQEACAVFLGQAQGLVPRSMAQFESFKRVRRDPSWLRRGYSEEIYTRVGLAPHKLAS